MEKSKKLSASIDKKNTNTQLIELCATLNSELAVSMLTRCTVEKITKCLRIGTYVHNMKESVLNI